MTRSNNCAPAISTVFGALYFWLLLRVHVCHLARLSSERPSNSQVSSMLINLTPFTDYFSTVPTNWKEHDDTQNPSTSFDVHGLYEPDKNRSTQNSAAPSINTTGLTTATTETDPLEADNPSCNVITETYSLETYTTIGNVPSNVTSETSASAKTCFFKLQAESSFQSINMQGVHVMTLSDFDFIVSISLCRQKYSTCTMMSVTNTRGSRKRVFYNYPDHEIYGVVVCPSCWGYYIILVYSITFKNETVLPISSTSDKAGYITTPGYDENESYPANVNFMAHLDLSPGEVILISFPHFHLQRAGEDNYCQYDSLTLSIINNTGMFDEWKECGLQDMPHMIFHTSIHLIFKSDHSVEMSGFKMLFTILSNAKEFAINAEGLINCSVPYFSQFARHLNCNLVVECMEMEDEKGCPYVTESCGSGQIDAGEKCYTYKRTNQKLSWKQAHEQCLSLNQTLINPRNPEEWNRFSSLMLQYGKKTTMVYTGLRLSQVTAADVPTLYRGMLQWSDQTMALYANVKRFRKTPPVCTMFLPESNAHSLMTVLCDKFHVAIYACERKSLDIPTPGKILILPLSVNHTWSVNVTSCPAGHKVRAFLSCDPQSQCWDENHGTGCFTRGDVKQFRCVHISQSIHYTLVCDFRQDCPDGSDESFCKHPECPENRCYSGQCITSSERCDGRLHCFDSSDEICPQVLIKRTTTPPPAKVDFSKDGGYILQSMNDSNVCAGTHFRCDDDYCLPIYVRCNGAYDCPDRQDEEDCGNYRCKGYFRCRASRVCLHPDHVCDGIVQCPKHDDELLCDLKCPLGCYCQGLAFVCNRSFPAESVPSLRYLDASGTEMTLTDLTKNVYLIYIRLSRCNIKEIRVHFPSLLNVQTLDLSHNMLKSLELDSILSLENLKVLILTRNPLTTIASATSSNTFGLKIINLASTQLTTINSTIFANFPELKELNLSSTRLTFIAEETFKIIKKVEVLDFRGLQMATYPNDMLKNLKFLKSVYSDDFKLCCKAALPEDFESKNCHAPSDYIASCEDLLRSDIYRVCLWMFALLALLGNAGSFVSRLYFQTESFQNSFSVFVTNLSIADFLMGVYLAIIGVADQSFRGRYIWKEDRWKQSIACKTAGFLSLLSSEVSAFFICLITLDRFLVLRFPFSRVHFSKKSALVASGIAWLIGFTLAAVPLLPMTSNWKFYSHTGICIPLPFTGKDTFESHSYSFSVMIVLNLVLFILIAVGQVLIYCAVLSSSMPQVKKRIDQDKTIARRLSAIVVSDFLCWFPIGLLGLLASIGIPIPVDVNVGVAILVLPFNSAVNPFLYTFNIIMEKRRKAAEAKLLERLSSCPSQLTVTTDTALNLIESWLGERVLTLTLLAKRFDMNPDPTGTTAVPNDSLQTVSGAL